MSDKTVEPLLSRLHMPTMTDCTPRLSVKNKILGSVPYFESENIDRPEGMTEHELKMYSCYGQKYDTNEKLVWNDLYGHASVLKTYSGYGGTINGVVPHGVYSPWAGMSGMDVCTGLPIAYSWLNYMDKFYAEQGELKVVPIAAPFIYAMCTLGYDPATEGKGTIFIPYHSTDIWDFDDDWYHVMLGLRKAGYPEPLAVMLFFEDVRKGRHRIFQKKGIPVYTAGEKFRPEFLYQFIHIVRHFKHVLINDVSTPAFYGAYMGKDILVTEDFNEYGVRYNNADTPWKETSPDGRAFPAEVYDTFSKLDYEQRWLARTILREDAKQTPERMKLMFEKGVEWDASEEGTLV